MPKRDYTLPAAVFGSLLAGIGVSGLLYVFDFGNRFVAWSNDRSYEEQRRMTEIDYKIKRLFEFDADGNGISREEAENYFREETRR